MNEAKHTPGPWDIAPRSAPYIADSDSPAIKKWLKESGKDRFDALSVGTKNGTVALIPLDESNSANARLIAAAPELLEASMKVLEWFEAEDDHSKADFYQRMQMCRDAEEMIRAAITKATGGAA